MIRLPLAAATILLLTSTPFAQQIAPVQVLSITAGPAGSEASGGFTLNEERSVFSRTADHQCRTRVVALRPIARSVGNPAVRRGQQVLASSQPRRVNYGKGSYTQSRWEIPTPPKAGFYRVDVTIDTTTFWRGFLRVDP